MPKKPKFRPTITRVKLNPEQAVLTCECYLNNFRPGANPGIVEFACLGGKSIGGTDGWELSSASS